MSYHTCNVQVAGTTRLIASHDSRGRQVVDVPHGVYVMELADDFSATLMGPACCETEYTLHPSVVESAFDDNRLEYWP